MKEKRMFHIVTRTWNPVTGCLHNCIYCWARRQALRLQKNNKTRKYKNGFKPTLHEYELNKHFPRNAIIFTVSMGDLFGDWVSSSWIEKVLDTIRRNPQTTFLLLTKNPGRYHEFIDMIPRENTILGVTIETTNDDIYINNKISDAPLPSERYIMFSKIHGFKKFVSIEPIIDFDLDVFTEWIRNISPEFVYIGYDNYYNKLPEPRIEKTLELVKRLEKTTRVYLKTMRPAWHQTIEKF